MQQSSIQDITPTLSAYTRFQVAFDYYNRRLFDSKVPQCLITLDASGKTFGYFSKSRFVDLKGRKLDKIALNSAYFAVTPIEDILSTLVHEMVHCYIEHHGDPGRRGYHNKEWGAYMESIGLMPTATGLPGGKKTGEKVSHFIVKGGGFDVATKQLLHEFDGIDWYDRYVHASPEEFIDVIERLQFAGVVGQLSPIPAIRFASTMDLCVPGRAYPADLLPKAKESSNGPLCDPDIVSNPAYQQLSEQIHALKKEVLLAEYVGDALTPSSPILHNIARLEGEVVTKFGEQAIEAISAKDAALKAEVKKELLGLSKTNRFTYGCSGCKSKVWGKPKLQIMCIPCNLKMRPLF